MLFRCRSEEYGDAEIDATDATEAAEAYAAAEVGECEATVLLTVFVADGDGDGWDRHKVQIDPTEPDCDDVEHAWKDGPVYGSGGGIAYTATCAHCGLRRHVDTWGTDPYDGTQGYRTVRYSAPDPE